MSALPALMTKIDLDNAGFEKGMKETSGMMDKLNKKMKSVSDSMKKTFTSMETIGKRSAIAFGATVGAITGVTKAAGNLESAMIRLEAVTAGNTDELNRFEKAIKDIRAGSAETMSTITNTMAKAKMLGSDLGLTTDEIIDLVDVSEKLSTIWGTDFEGTVEGLMYGLSGATRQLRQYGIQLSDTELEQIALNKGFKEGTKNMSEVEKAQLRYEVVMEKLQTQMALAEKAGASFNVQIDRVKNAIIDLSAAVGEKFLEDITGGLSNMGDLLIRISQSPALTQMIADFLKLGIAVAGLGTILGIVGKLGNLALTVLATGFTLLTNPVFLAAVAIGLVVANLNKLAAAWDGVKAVWDAADPSKIAEDWETLKNALSEGDWSGTLKGGMTIVFDGLKAVWGGISEATTYTWETFLSKLPENFEAKANEMKSLMVEGTWFEGLKTFGSMVLDVIWAGIQTKHQIITDINGWIREKVATSLGLSEAEANEIGTLEVYAKGALELAKIIWDSVIKLTEGVLSTVASWLNDHLDLEMPDPVAIEDSLKVIGAGGMELFAMIWGGAVDILESALVGIAGYLNKNLDLELPEPVSISEAFEVIGAGTLKLKDWLWDNIEGGVSVAHNKASAKLDELVTGTKKESYSLSETFSIMGTGILNILSWSWKGLQYASKAIGNVIDWWAERVREGLGLSADENVLADLGDVKVIVAGVLNIVENAFTLASDALANFNTFVDEKIEALKVDTVKKTIPFQPGLEPDWTNITGYKMPDDVSEYFKSFGEGVATLVGEGFKASFNILELVKEAMRNLATEMTGSEAAGNVAGQIPIAFTAMWAAGALTRLGQSLKSTFTKIGFKGIAGQAAFVLATYVTIDMLTNSEIDLQTKVETMIAGAMAAALAFPIAGGVGAIAAYGITVYIIPKLKEAEANATIDRMKENISNATVGIWEGMGDNPAASKLEDNMRKFLADMPTLASWYDKELRAFNAGENNLINNFNRVGYNLGMAAIGAIWKLFRNIGDYIWKAVKEDWEAIIDVGKKIGDGIKNGIETALNALNPLNWFKNEKPNPEVFQKRLDIASEKIESVDAWSQFEEAFKNAPNPMQNLFEGAGSDYFTPWGGKPVPVEIVDPIGGGRLPEGNMLIAGTGGMSSGGYNTNEAEMEIIKTAIDNGVIMVGDLANIIMPGLEETVRVGNENIVQAVSDNVENTKVEDSLMEFSKTIGEGLEPMAEMAKRFEDFMEKNLGETDNAMLGLKRDLFTMMTGLVQSLAQNNLLLQDELSTLIADLGVESDSVQKEVQKVKDAVKNTELNVNGTTPVTGEIVPMQGLYQEMFEGGGSEAATKLKELTDTTDETTNALDSFEQKIMTTLSGIAETLNPLNIVAGWLGSLQSGLQGLISAIDPIAAIFRGINKALAPVLERLMKPLEHLGFLIGKALIPVVQFLAKVFEGVAYIIAGVWNALASVLNVMLGWLGVAIPMINFGESWEEEQEHSDEMTNTAGWHQPINNTFNVTFTGNTVLDTDDEAMELLADKFLQYCREHDIEVVT